MFRKEMLRPGDIVFYKPKAKWSIGSWLITWAQNVVGKSPIHGVSYSHVVLIDHDTDYIVESRYPRSRRYKMDWKKYENQYDFELWRVRNVKPEQVDKALDWAYAHLNEWYDLGLFLFGWIDRKKSEVCSTFVAKAWRAGGVVFGHNTDMGNAEFFHSPDEIAMNTDLIKRIA